MIPQDRFDTLDRNGDEKNERMVRPTEYVSPFASSAKAVRLFLKNLHIIFPVYLVLFLSYFLVVLAILSIVPIEKIEEIGYGVDNEEQVVKELTAYFTKNLTKTVTVLLLFGLIIFVLYEFNSAGLTAVSVLVSKTGKASLKDFFEKGFIYTPKVAILELLGGLIIFALLSPLTTIFYFTQHVYLAQALMYVVMVVFLLILTYAKFFLVDRDEGIVASMAEAVRFMIKKPGSVMVYFLWFLITLPFSMVVLAFPFVIVLFPALVTLMYIMMANYYVEVVGASYHRTVERL
jgi:hypothetical protein